MKRILVALLATILLATPAFASPYILDDETMSRYGNNGIYYYNPTGVRTCSSYSGEIAVYGTTSAEKIWTGLTSFMTAEQAAGIMGNMQHESNYFNPAQHEISQQDKYQPGFNLQENPDIAYGIGLIQWSYTRRINLLNYIAQENPELLAYFENYQTYSPGYEITGDKFIELAGEDIANELIAYELQSLKDELENYWSDFFNTSSVYDATKYFLEEVEKPSNPFIEAYSERVADAEGYYNQFANLAISANDASVGGIGCGYSSDAGALQELVLKYAWPEYHAPKYVDLMPDYASAISNRSSAGKYIGGISYRGVDCGGFVTTLMQESGFAPDYNTPSGDTTNQENWVKSNGWTLLNASTNTEVDTSVLQPGDVAFSTGHTFVYVGDLPGFDSNIASASLDERAPMAGRESLVFGNGTIVRWYRKP